MKKTITIAVIGSAHSGSTILARYLSQIEGAIALGEIHSVLRNKSLDKSPAVRNCSCGRELTECPIWQNWPSTRDELYNSLDEKIVIDSSKGRLGDFNVFIYKNPFQLAKSADSINSFFRLLSSTIKRWILVLGKPHISVSLTRFSRRPKDIIRRVAREVNATIEWRENSHIAYSNKSKYGPLKIRPVRRLPLGIHR